MTDYGVCYPSRSPHITFADYNRVDESQFIIRLEKLLANQKQMDLSLKMLGSFFKTGTLFIAPTFSRKLYDLHAAIHETLIAYDTDENSFYLPECWSPHCTIASRLDEMKMSEVFHYCQTHFVPMVTQLKQMALIEITLNDANIAISDRILYSNTLNI